MNDNEFKILVSSLKEAGKIHRKETCASRIFEFSPLVVKEIRTKVGLSQEEFALLIHISKRTLQNWEQGIRRPHGPALALLAALKNDPKHVISALRHE